MTKKFSSTSIRRKDSMNTFLIIKLSIILLLMLTINLTFSQSAGCQIHLHVEAFPAHCQADGIIRCTLSDTAGAHLEQIKYSYISVTGRDSIMETSLSEITDLQPGMYQVQVSAICYAGLGQDSTYILVKDSAMNVVVGSEYEVPVNGLPRNVYSSQFPFGIVPSLSCLPTGKIQLYIQNGKFPYYVDVWRIDGTDTLFLKTLILDTNQHSGTDNRRSDFQFYYDIDSLAVGQYMFRCHDGCDYFMPLIYGAVPEVKFNVNPNAHLLGNSSCVPSSYNVIKIKELCNYLNDASDFSYNDDYYRLTDSRYPNIEYRFVNPSLTDTKDTTHWLKMPMPSPNHDFVFLYDTVTAISRYEQIWGNSVCLQIRFAPCDEILFSKDYTIYREGHLYFADMLLLDSSFSSPAIYDSCGYRSAFYRYTYYRSGFMVTHDPSFSCDRADSVGCSKYYGYTNDQTLRSYHTLEDFHNYITLPVKYNLYNVTGDSLLIADSLRDHNYHWRIFITLNKKLFGDSLFLEIKDARGSLLYSNGFRYLPNRKVDAFGNYYYYYKWLTWNEAGRPLCSGSGRKMGVFQKYATLSRVPVGNHLVWPYVGDTIKLIQSPENNKYTFTAVATDSAQWQVTKDRLDNLATIEFGTHQFINNPTSPGILMTGNLPSGRYVWVILSPCHSTNDTITDDVIYPENPVITTNPQYNFNAQCTQLDIVPTAGQYSIRGVPTTTYFQVHLGNEITRAYPSVLSHNTLTVGVPGTYVLSMFTIPQSNFSLLEENPCYRKDTVIVWDGGTIVYDYLYSYVCSASDSIGVVRAHGKHGSLPNTYKLFAQPDGHGQLLAQNQTGDFFNVPLHFGQQMSVEMRDACDAHFLTNFTVTDMEHLRKCWAENNLNSVTACEGSDCHFYALSLGNVSYHWTGPNDFYSDSRNPVLHIDRNAAASGTYFVSIEGSGCTTMLDSLSVQVVQAPSVSIAQDTSICPGRTVQVRTTTHGYGRISYTLMQKDCTDTASLCFQNREDHTTDTTFWPIYRNNTIFYITNIKDARCRYSHPDDTVTVTLKPQSSAVEIIAGKDTVCYGETAVLSAYSSGGVPYRVNWYEDSSLITLMKSDTIGQIGEKAYARIPDLRGDSTLFVEVVSEEGCPYVHGMEYEQMNMNRGVDTLRFGEDVVFYDSGGGRGRYDNHENLVHTFYSRDTTSPITLHVNELMCQSAIHGEAVDVLYIFDGPSTEGTPALVLKGQLVEGDLPDYTSTHGSLTAWFVSNHPSSFEDDSDSYLGWNMTLSVHALPKAAIAVVRPQLTVALQVDTSSTLDTIRAVVEGGSRPYYYVWEKSVDSLTWIPLQDNASILSVDSLFRTTWLRVSVSDDSVWWCGVVSEPAKLQANMIFLPPCPSAVDYDGNRYSSVRIDHDCWTQENLRSLHYSDGREIPNVMEYWADMYPDRTMNVGIFGRLYNWFAAIDTVNGLNVNGNGHIQGICPQGWYLPLAVQYVQLSAHGTTALRVADYWINGTGGNNSSGFSALPAGFFNGLSHQYENLMGETRFWSTGNQGSDSMPSCISLHFFCSDVQATASPNINGYSIRCILEE